MGAVREIEQQKSPEWQAADRRWIKGGKHTEVPNSYFDSLPSRVSHLEFVIVGQILRQTRGGLRDKDNQRPERVPITADLLAGIISATANGVRNALANLCKLGIVESRPTGRSYEYRALPDNFADLPRRAQRKAKPVASEGIDSYKDPPEDEADTASAQAVSGGYVDENKQSRIEITTEKIVLMPGPDAKPMPLSQALRATAIDWSHSLPFAISPKVAWESGRFKIHIDTASAQAVSPPANGKTTASTQAVSGGYVNENKHLALSSGARSGNRPDAQADAAFELCYSRWKKYGASRENTRKLFIRTFAAFTRADIAAFRDGFAAWVKHNEAVGWRYVKATQTLDWFLTNQQWRYPPPNPEAPPRETSDQRELREALARRAAQAARMAPR